MRFDMEILYPELSSFPPEDRVRALHDARQTPFDTLELFGMAAALVIVTALTDYSGGGLDGNQRFFSGVLNYLAALPLLAVTLGPFLIRRVRRGLRSERNKLAGKR